MSVSTSQLKNIRLFLMMAGEEDFSVERGIEIQTVLEQYDLSGSVLRAPSLKMRVWLMD